mgnify:CR=1 FL=1
MIVTDAPRHLGKVVCVAQARMTSSRLPGKILMTAAGKPLLQWHLERLQAAKRVDQVALATTSNLSDDPVAELAEKLGVFVFRGSEHDVLGRFAGCAAACGADTVIRVTADCPLIDPALIDDLADAFAATPTIDYCSIDVGRFPRGLDAEIFAYSSLAQAASEAQEPFEREHVTPFIYRRPDRFRLGAPLGPPPGAPPPLAGRWCVDEAADLELIRLLLAELPPDGVFGWRDVCMLISQNPDWADVNRDVAQRKLGA